MRDTPLQTPAEELAELRALIVRMRMREASLSALLRNAPATVPQRAGWPILQRHPPATPQPTTRH